LREAIGNAQLGERSVHLARASDSIAKIGFDCSGLPQLKPDLAPQHQNFWLIDSIRGARLKRILDTGEWLWSTIARRDGWPQWARAAAQGQCAVPAVRAPEDIMIVVAGGDLEIPQHAYFPSWGFPPCRIVKDITT
jgi:hypothetical protein